MRSQSCPTRSVCTSSFKFINWMPVIPIRQGRKRRHSEVKCCAQCLAAGRLQAWDPACAQAPRSQNPHLHWNRTRCPPRAGEQLLASAQFSSLVFQPQDIRPRMGSQGPMRKGNHTRWAFTPTGLLTVVPSAWSALLWHTPLCLFLQDSAHLRSPLQRLP